MEKANPVPQAFKAELPERIGQDDQTNGVSISTKGAKFPGSFAPSQRVHDTESTLPIPRAKLTLRTLLTPLTKDWTSKDIWASALIEAVGTFCLSYVSGLLGVTFGNFDTIYTPNWVGITNVFLLGLLIYGTAPSSGGHLNPFISFGTMLAGLTGFSRAVLYMIGQTAGAAAAGGLFRASFGDDAVTKYNGGGCFLEPDAFPTGQAFLIEMVSSFVLLFLAQGIALDPRQAQLSGPMLGPLLVACSLGLLTFASSGIAPGYAGAGMNPARCFAYAVARGNFRYQWIWWFGPCAGAFLSAAIYRAVPPYHAQR